MDDADDLESQGRGEEEENQKREQRKDDETLIFHSMHASQLVLARGIRNNGGRRK